MRLQLRLPDRHRMAPQRAIERIAAGSIRVVTRPDNLLEVVPCFANLNEQGVTGTI